MNRRILMGKQVERSTGIALWRQVADHIRQRISDGVYDTRMMLPPETELAEGLGINRHTVRRAIAALASEGVVRPQQGIGTIIRQSRKLRLPLSRRTRFSEGVGTQAKTASATLLSWRTEVASDEICGLLMLERATPCIVLETTHSADGVPVSTATNWFESRRYSSMPEKVGELGSISAALSACGVTDYVRLSTEISASHASNEDRARLKLSAGAIILETKALNGEADGKPIQFSLSRLDAGRTSLYISFDGDT